jgi:hypothetical protein
MSDDPHDRTDAPGDSADTASFQEFVDRERSAPVDDGRTFRLLTLLVGLLVAAGLVWLLLQ